MLSSFPRTRTFVPSVRFWKREKRTQKKRVLHSGFCLALTNINFLALVQLPVPAKWSFFFITSAKDVVHKSTTFDEIFRKCRSSAKKELIFSFSDCALATAVM